MGFDFEMEMDNRNYEQARNIINSSSSILDNCTDCDLTGIPTFIFGKQYERLMRIAGGENCYA